MFWRLASGSWGRILFLAVVLACLLYGVSMNPQTSLDEMTRWCFIAGGAVLFVGALYFVVFPPNDNFYLDSEGFKLSANKIPWTDVLSISKKED